MKKLLIIVLLTLIPLYAQAGDCKDYSPINQAITTASTFVAVRAPASLFITSYAVWTEDGAAWYYATDSAGSDAILITNDGTDCKAYSKTLRVNSDSSGSILFYAKGTSSTNLVGFVTVH